MFLTQGYVESGDVAFRGKRTLSLESTRFLKKPYNLQQRKNIKVFLEIMLYWGKNIQAWLCALVDSQSPLKKKDWS